MKTPFKIGFVLESQLPVEIIANRENRQSVMQPVTLCFGATQIALTLTEVDELREALAYAKKQVEAA